MFGKRHTDESKRKISESRRRYQLNKHPSWKGGRRINHNGYVEIRMPHHHRARKNGYVFEHIVVAEEKIGRRMELHETVHHLDGNKQNNYPDNLEVIIRADHSKIYPSKKRTGRNLSCMICGSEFYVKPSHIDDRKTCRRQCQSELFRRRKGECI